MEYKTTVVFSRCTLFFLGPSPPPEKNNKQANYKIIYNQVEKLNPRGKSGL